MMQQLKIKRDAMEESPSALRTALLENDKDKLKIDESIQANNSNFTVKKINLTLPQIPTIDAFKSIAQKLGAGLEYKSPAGMSWKDLNASEEYKTFNELKSNLSNGVMPNFLGDYRSYPVQNGASRPTGRRSLAS